MILEAKLHCPVTTPDLVYRQRLHDRLDAGLAGPATLVSAPAGYGKSMLVSHWAELRLEPWTAELLEVRALVGGIEGRRRESEGQPEDGREHGEDPLGPQARDGRPRTTASSQAGRARRVAASPPEETSA
jgi:hypothetical protein